MLGSRRAALGPFQRWSIEDPVRVVLSGNVARAEVEAGVNVINAGNLANWKTLCAAALRTGCRPEVRRSPGQEGSAPSKTRQV